MKRFISACVLCTGLLVTGVFVFAPKDWIGHVFAQTRPPKDVLIEALLSMPAPPPVNPLEPQLGPRDEKFYDPKNPPPDDAPIEDLIEYWTHQNNNFRGAANYQVKPSVRVVERMVEEAERGGLAIGSLTNILPTDRQSVDAIKAMYDRGNADAKKELKSWLLLNSPYFADSLERVAERTRDNANNYVDLNAENHVLALTQWDWERAQPIVQRLYNDTSQPVSRVLATWALYKHALDVGDVSDIDRYRSELMRAVENRNLPDGVRDKANDALTHEVDFPGRDEWTFSLFEDPTLVNMRSYTMLTTLFMYSQPDKYVPKMIELVHSDNKLVRKAAARNLLLVLDRVNDPEIVRALLPWLEDPKWIDSFEDQGGRQSLIAFLLSHKMPESVPGLIAALNEKAVERVPDYSNDSVVGNSANAMIAAQRAMGNTASTMANRVYSTGNTDVAIDGGSRVLNSSNYANTSAFPIREIAYYPLRDGAIRALGFQGDVRAVSALRRLLAQAPGPGFDRAEIVRAILLCGGYSVGEQVDALDYVARHADEIEATPGDAVMSNMNTGYIANVPMRPGQNFPIGIDINDPKSTLGIMVASLTDVSDVLAHGTIDRIESLQAKEPAIASKLRQIIVHWNGLAVSALLLRDVKNDRAESAAVVRLLTERKTLREKLAQDVFDVRTGSPTAAGIAACIVEDLAGYESIIEGQSIDAKIALFACGRLIRAELPIAKVAASLKSTNATLKTAAELYLESEDSPEARAVVLGQHPNEAKVMGATFFFPGKGGQAVSSAELYGLFMTVNPVQSMQPYQYSPVFYDSPAAKTEKKLQKEVIENADLIGMYAYDSNFIRIYKDRAVFSWEDDPARFHERQLTPEEFNYFKGFLGTHHVEQMKPFLACRDNECGDPKELLMLSRNGGSRVFVRTSRMPAFFAELEKIFSDLRSQPAAIKYLLSKDVPGLELLFASDEFSAETVWKHGSDLRLVVSNNVVREKVDAEVAELDDEGDDTASDESDKSDGSDEKSPADKMREKRQYEGMAWRKFDDGKLGDQAAQPEGVEFFKPTDNLAIRPNEEQWKARVGSTEIRIGDGAIFRVTNGRVAKLKDGEFSNAVVTANGRWLVVNKMDDEQGPSLVRINLATGYEYKVDEQEYGNLVPKAFVPAVGKFVLAQEYFDDGPEGPGDDETADETQPADTEPSTFFLLDPETGTLTQATGEMRPLAEETFRPLQATGRPNEFWAALATRGRNETEVGLYDSRLFRFKPILRLPKISFGSMDTWVDEAEGKVYFVYNGHLLRVPLKQQPHA